MHTMDILVRYMVTISVACFRILECFRELMVRICYNCEGFESREG